MGKNPENNPSPEMVLSCLREEISRQGGLLPLGARGDEIYRYGAFVGANILSHRELPRAMNYARQLIDERAKENRSMASGTVILADTMSQAKGRFTRSWHAPVGGVWGCMVHGNNLLPESRQFVSMAAGVACCQALREYAGEKVSLRWVNDVLVNGRKLAGFLVESYTEPVYGEEFTLVGFGINVNNSNFPDELEGMAVSLKQHLGTPVDLSTFTARFLGRLAWNFGLIYSEEARLLAGDGYSGENGRHLILENWLKLSDTVGRRVVYGFDVMTEPQYSGTVLGVDDAGGLRILLDDGFEKTEYSGEVRYKG